MKQLLFLILAGWSIKGIAQTPVYENLVFEGAGIRGLAYSGVVKQLEKHKILTGIKKVGGTSAGAITALMVSIGYSHTEIYDIISETKFQKFNDGGPGGISRMKKRYGWYKGEKFTQWLEKIIKDKTGNANITFKELKEKGFKELYVTATCLNKQELVVFSAENYPLMKVKDAIRISMSIPFYFEAVFIDSTGSIYKKRKDGQNLDIVLDGGIVGNFPIFIFDSIYVDSAHNKIRIPNKKTLGIRIDSDQQIERDKVDQELVEVEINSISDFTVAFYVMVLENLNRNKLTDDDWKRTISISSKEIGPRIKKLSQEQKQMLMKSGEDYTLRFLKTL